MTLQYNHLDASIKKSFYRSTQLTIFDLIDTMTTEAIQKDFVTDLFVKVVVEELMKKRGFQNWANMDFEIDDEEMKELVQMIVERRRKYKPTKKQKEFYLVLTSKLGEEEVIPNDFLVFQKRLVEMKDKAPSILRATDKQKETICDLVWELWGKKITLKDDLSQNEVQQYFTFLRKKDSIRNVSVKGKEKNKEISFEFSGEKYEYTYDGLVAHGELNSCMFCPENGNLCCEFLTDIEFLKDVLEKIIKLDKKKASSK
ncbi:hypothetical protein [Bacillus sp. BML-BC060]|uniref:hypothetical protein n=1 Tax=Bacillus sp. BML-BC060 TaxID=2842487 RepID=UPI001C7E2A8A|nr:hypothetical protein [Bacillus sp. BML-BC060]